MTERPEFTTREYRDRVRSLAVMIVSQGKGKMREHIHLLRLAAHFNKFYKLDFFEPYQYQMRWFRSGANYLLRYLSAANQIGKTYGEAVEFAIQATALYPVWWPGFRCDRASDDTRIMWAIGISTDATRKVLQKELLGTNDARKRKEMGSGSIPRERIDFDSFITDGETVKSFRVWDATGGQTEIHFYSSTQDEKVFMGQRVMYIWVDEQSEKEAELIAQCTTRTTNTEGCVACTATPEVGATDFYNQCKHDKTGEIYFQNATWNDAPHITPERRKSMEARIPYWQRKMRSEGVPVLGVGAIYPYSDEQITCTPFKIPDHWLVLAGLDFGYSGLADPSIILFVAYDPETGKKYVFQEWSSEGEDLYGVPESEVYFNSHMPDYMARKIIDLPPEDWEEATGKEPVEFVGLGLPSIRVISPSDGNGQQAGTNMTRLEVMRDVGALTCPDAWQLHETQLPGYTNRKTLQGSISLLAQWFQDNDLKIFNTCTGLLHELRLYQWVKEGKKTVPSDKNNHHLDAMRYCSTRVEFDGVTMLRAKRKIQPPVDHSKSPYKRAMRAYSKAGAKKL
ncbi:hypothetical protein FDX19_15610 [Citrobacter sp. wls619]|uniref:terminase large subunit domain-containing protein n=1 Tax=Citrobacter sp. wls619 TaxID=2576432 RepID=UPI0010C9CA39|nr:terminase family protein [Citrobacter sp. wls619]TKV08263.1 hypothetical protein FDX19_15610 [Citrobacter sp. wls619]